MKTGTSTGRHLLNNGSLATLKESSAKTVLQQSVILSEGEPMNFYYPLYLPELESKDPA